MMFSHDFDFGPKMMYGKLINGGMFANLATTYVEAFNTGKAPVISSGEVIQTKTTISYGTYNFLV